MYENKFYTCRYDRPFKEIMLKEENKDILKVLLETILKVEIKEIKIKPTERNTGNIKVKRKTFDALLETNEGKIGIEVNSKIEEYVRPRSMAYISDIYAHHTLVGESYDEETNIIQINLTYGITKTGDKKAYRKYEIKDEEGKQYVKNFKIIEYNMDYYKKIWENKEKRLVEENKYLVMLDLPLEELRKLSKTNRMVNKYMKNLEEINNSPEFREYMSKEEDERKIRNTREKVFERKQKELEEKEKEIDEKEKEINTKEHELMGIGSKNEKILIATNMLNDNFHIDTICKITGLSTDEIEEIKKSF